jgi:uncharacterized protein
MQACLTRAFDEEFRPSSFVVKIANVCNLRCSYCYYFHGSGINAAHRGYPRFMLPETLAGLQRFSRRLAEAYDLRRMRYCWHGGEPLCTPVGHFRATLEMQREELESAGIEVRNSLQTNGTLLDDERVALLRDHQISVGVSLDGWRDDFDGNRPAAGRRTTFERITRNIGRLIESRVPCGVLTVVDGRRDLTALVTGLYAMGIRSIAFLPCSISPDGHPIQPRLIAERIIEAYRHARDTGLEDLRFRTLASLRSAYFDRPSSVCTVGPKTCFNYFTVMPDGELTLCETLLAAGYERAFLGLNVTDPQLRPEDLAAVVRERMREIDALDTSDGTCGGCEWERVCGRGCLAARFRDGRFGASSTCEVSRAICDWVEAEVEGLMTPTRSTLVQVL